MNVPRPSHVVLVTMETTFLSLVLATSSLSEAPLEAHRKPPALEPGEAIALVAPASSAPADQIARAVANIEKRGYRTKVFADPSEKRGYLAGDDAARAEALNRAIRDPEVKAILCLRGGYGTPRILDRVDYEALAAQPKILVGYSDATALLVAATKRAGIVCFHGPMGREWALGNGPSPFSERHFWAAFSTGSPLFSDWGGARAPGMKAPTTLAPGVAEGVLAGGNLSLVCALLGTPYEIETRGAILFLEEVAEKPFRIDRMLNQLRLSGKLAEVRGVLLGAFEGCDARDPEGGLELTQVFSDYLIPLGVPVLAGYPAGHTPDQATLPLGLKVRLDAGAKTLSFLEPPVEARPGEPRAAPEAPR